MTHLEQYDEIINFRKSNPLPEDQYGENHHIVPKSICPMLQKSNENIVRLSAQEHFLAHYHLWLAYRDELKEKKWARKMCFAFHRMKQQLMKCSDIEEMANLYAACREEFSRLNSGKNNPQFGKHKTLDEQTRRKMSESKMGNKNPMFGKPHSLQTRQKTSESLKGHVGYWTGKKQTPESIAKRSLKNKGKKRSQKTCKQISEALKTKRWWNNGINNSFSEVCPEGYWSGMIRKPKAESK